MRNFGFASIDKVIYSATNGKITEMVAAMGSGNLYNIDILIDTNRQNYESHREGLATIPGIRLLSFGKTERNNYQRIVIEMGESCLITQDEIIAELRAENIRVRRYLCPGATIWSPTGVYNPSPGCTSKHPKGGGSSHCVTYRRGHG